MRSNLSNRHILIVDDEPDIRDFLKWEFEDRGAIVYETDDFDQALKYFEQNRPDFSVLDIRMAVGSGVELLAACKALCPELPIALMTGYTEVSLRSIFEKGACDVFLKPLQYDVLFPRVDKEIGPLEQRFVSLDKRPDVLDFEIESLHDEAVLRFGKRGFVLKTYAKRSIEQGRLYSIGVSQTGALSAALRWAHLSQRGGLKLGFELIGITEELKTEVLQQLAAAQSVAFIPTKLLED
jgi:CheY-like chemotaxis protein